MNLTVTDQVRAIVADLFGVPLEEVGPQSSPSTIEAWDSMQHLNLTIDLEMTFGVRLGPQEIQGMKDVAAVVSAVEKQLASPAAGVECEPLPGIL